MGFYKVVITWLFYVSDFLLSVPSNIKVTLFHKVHLCYKVKLYFNILSDLFWREQIMSLDHVKERLDIGLCI
jgi:hypothetical protein